MVLPAAFDPTAISGNIAFVGIDLVPEADPRAALADLHEDFVSWDLDGFGVFEYPEPGRPAEIVNAQSMRALPLLVGGLLAGPRWWGWRWP